MLQAKEDIHNREHLHKQGRDMTLRTVIAQQLKDMETCHLQILCRKAEKHAMPKKTSIIKTVAYSYGKLPGGNPQVRAKLSTKACLVHTM